MPRIARVSLPALLLIAAFAALLAALAYGGAAAPQLISDPGAVVRWGLPASKLLVDLGAAGAIGSLAIAVFALKPGERPFERALDIASVASVIWTLAAAFTAFLTFLTLYLKPVTADPQFGQLLGRFLTDTELGRTWLWATLIAAAVSIFCFSVRNHTALLFVALLAVGGLVPLAAQGHSGGTADHDVAVSALWMHIVAAAVWLGGLLTIVLLRGSLGDRLSVVVRRYSSLALLCYVVMVVSGYVSAEVRIGSFEGLFTPYGVLVLVKIAALVVLGAAGAWQRRVIINRIERNPSGKSFWGLAALELAFMGIASGVAAALARTATPKPEVIVANTANPTPAEILTGRPLPPEPELSTWITAWQLDPFWSTACAMLLFFYLAGVWRLSRRGDRWPVHRTVVWVIGILMLFWVTNGSFMVYERYLFSVHMLGHMLLAMVIPILLVIAAPITLALRSIEKRNDGTRGVREWIMLAVHSRYLALLSNPIVAAVIFVGSLWLFYFTPIFSWAITDHIGHYWMIVHFLASGYLFALVLIGTDPIPSRPAYPLRLVLLLATMAAHAFFGLAIISSSGLLLADWYGAMGRTWGDTPMVDQQTGGGITWSIGEIPTLALAVAVAIMWSRQDTRETRRIDRQADRDGDAELAEWNRMLAERAERDQQLRG
ncbi:cytochrome c oxidase assembly protein [Ruicaihuangia caeni]|uniref:cytochrome c oxidase assembly protein n=1 Tax=Ruicaihuangia caeni TaxID=3042517 RepID=UPI0033906B1A